MPGAKRRQNPAGVRRNGKPRAYKVQGMTVTATCAWRYGIWIKRVGAKTWVAHSYPDELTEARAALQKIGTGYDAMLLAAPAKPIHQPTVLATR